MWQVCFLLKRLRFSTANDTIAIGKNMVVDNRNQPCLVQLLQHFKQAFPFSGRKLANEVVYFYWCYVRAEMDAAVLGIMIVIDFLCTGIFVQWVPPLPSKTVWL